MFSSSDRSPKRVGRVFLGVVLALLAMAIFAILDARGVEATAASAVAAGPATLTENSSGRLTAPEIFEALSSLGREAARVLTTMITAVFSAWWQPMDGALDWMDGARRELSAVHRFFGTRVPAS
jgi:hypothetical protein